MPDVGRKMTRGAIAGLLYMPWGVLPGTEAGYLRTCRARLFRRLRLAERVPGPRSGHPHGVPVASWAEIPPPSECTILVCPTRGTWGSTFRSRPIRVHPFSFSDIITLPLHGWPAYICTYCLCLPRGHRVEKVCSLPAARALWVGGQRTIEEKARGSFSSIVRPYLGSGCFLR